MISINSFDNVVINGESVGDCISAANNYPKQAAEILQALIAYDAVRQGEADVKSTEAAIAQAKQSAEPLQQKIAELEGTIAHLTAKLQALTPSLAEILDQLLAAGLTAWSERSIAAYHPGDHQTSIVPEIAELFAAAKDNRIAEVPMLFGLIVEQTGITPNPEEAQRLQTVLDSVRFPAELLNFRPWIKP